MAGFTVNIDGYEITKTLYQEMALINLLTSEVLPPQNVLIVQMVQDDRRPTAKDLAVLLRRYTERGANALLCSVRGDSFWKDGKNFAPAQPILSRTVLDWLAGVSRIAG